MLKFSVLVTILLLGAGCSLLEYSGDYGNAILDQKHLEKLIAAEKYHEAETYLTGIKTSLDSETYRAQQQRLADLIAKFTAATERAAATLAESGDLFGAIKWLDLALKKIPASARLQELAAKFRQERDLRLAENERLRMLSKAEYLLAQSAYFEELTRLEKLSLTERWQQNLVNSSLSGLSRELLNCGEQATESARPAVAEECLAMAARIDDSGPAGELPARPEPSAESGKIEAVQPVVLMAATKKTKPAALASASFPVLGTALNQALAKGELTEAGKILVELARFPGREKEINDYRRRLETARKEMIDNLLEEGSRLYRLGKINEARTSWQQVLGLDPENQPAREKIARADKVIKNIENLRKNQQQTTDR